MLNIINRYTHGFVFVPIVLACRQRGLFELLTQRGQMKSAEIIQHLGANEGHFLAALRMLQSLNWLSRDSDSKYQLTSHADQQQQIPQEILEIYTWDMHAYLLGEGGKLGKWLELSQARWHLSDQRLADFLDGAFIIPLLVTIKKHNLLDQTKFHSFNLTIREELTTLFVGKDWAQCEAGQLYLTDTGRFMLDRALITGVAASYRPMLSRATELLFGNPEAIFQRDTSGHEQHLDRTLNVVASGFQHEKYFADIEETILAIFNRLPVEEQPDYVADMGCGDGHLLARVYDTIRSKSARGKILDQHPVHMIGVDYNLESLEATAKTLADIPHSVLQGDIGRPDKLIVELQQRAIDPEAVLHIRSFLDHDRPILPLENENAAQIRAKLPLEEVYVDTDGSSIAPHTMVQGLVEHLTRWAKAVNKHGMMILEVHSLGASTVSRFLDESENLHFDALQAFSSQHLVGAPVFLMAAAEAGLFAKTQYSKRYPRTLPFTRITSQHFEKRPYCVRHPKPEDLTSLIGLEAHCWPEPLRASDAEIQQRIESFPQGQCVLAQEGKVIGVVYSQRITHADALNRTNFKDVSSLHTQQGTIIQLLTLNMLPEMQQYGFGDQLLEFMLQYCTLQSGIDRVVGVTLCKDYASHASIPMEEYIQQRNQRGERQDPILRFHESHGAQIKHTIAGYRPEDVANQGKGVFIEYDLRSRQPKLPSKSPEPIQQTTPEPSEQSIATQVKEAISSLLSPKNKHEFSAERSLSDMGLDSLDTMELSTLLSKQFKEELSDDFFLQHRTAEAISQFLQNKQTTESKTAASASNAVEKAIFSLLGQKNQDKFSAERPLTDMGLDSLDMMELSTLLSQEFNTVLSDDFFLCYRTPNAIADFLQNNPSTTHSTTAPATEEQAPADFSAAAAEIPQIHAIVTEQKRRKLRIDDRWVYDFASCNYLGLDLHSEVMAAVGPAIEKWGVHPSWTRAVASPAIYDELEQELADLVGAPSVLAFPAITLLHMGVMPILAGNDGIIFKDISAHRSIDEACCLAQTSGAKFINFKHNDVADLERKLASYPYERTKIIAIDGVYSMSGGYPKLPEFAALAKQYNAWVYMDDAHGMGIVGENPTPDMPYGQKGNGIVQHFGMDYADDRLIYVSGLSKSYSSFGAFITCTDEAMRDRFKAASTFIFSGPSPVASLASAIAGLKLNRSEGSEWRKQIYKLTYKLVTEARALGFEVVNDNFFPIVGIVIGTTKNVITACNILWDYGILITPALFPIVPMDQGLLRFSITAANTEEQIDQSLSALATVRNMLEISPNKI